ncbi:Abi family protein [Texcoconibacillus texcoconensis]|uniref:Abortive infection bacteriophage resistance protein n=1 Tax=Texcoconibacillus texcoconensis TaxID=1095777 RepID=A0A840QM33_9BACI|nr:abortive infection bacteriophage resistance protein [Texcoconibacillus texcoconensis]
MTTNKSHIKNPTTIEEQIKIFKSRHLIIKDEEAAISFLKRVNYYRLSAYGLTLKRSDNTEKFLPGTSFSHLVSLYQFDRKLRELLIGKLEVIEIAFRAQISYHHAHKYGSLGYKTPSNFSILKYHTTFLENLDRLIHENRHELFVHHHQSKYNGEFPFWVAIEVISFGSLSKLFRNLKNIDKSAIAKEHYDRIPYKYIESWLHALSYLRNICAHHGRLYGKKLVIKPRLFNNIDSSIRNSDLFSAVYILIHLLPHNEKVSFVIDLRVLIEQYSDYIHLPSLGFPEKWDKLLRL